MQAGTHQEAIEIGVRLPVPTPVAELGPGEVGYLIAGIKDVGQARSRRDRHHVRPIGATEALEGYRDPKPMVFCGLFPIDGDDFENLRESLEKLQAQRRVDHLHAGVLGRARLRLPLRVPRPAAHGDRQGAAGARVQPRAHRHRAERGVPGHAAPTARSSWSTTRPTCRRRRRSTSSRSRSSGVSIITPKEYTGTLMELCQTRRGEMTKLEYLSPERVELHYHVPLAEVVVDFFDQMKSRTQGYASLDYELERLPAQQPGAGRPAAERRAGRRVQHHRPPRQGLRVRPRGCARS